MLLGRQLAREALQTLLKLPISDLLAPNVLSLNILRQKNCHKIYLRVKELEVASTKE
jgi:hypothetical protein